MKTLRNLKEHSIGLIDCEILLGEDWHPHAIEVTEEYELHESSEWEGVKPLPQAEKDAYAAKQARDNVVQDIEHLESKQTARKVREAALGNQDAIEFLQNLENEIDGLRKQL